MIIYLAEAFLVAYLMRLLAYRLKLPAVTGYVIGGVILGGSLFYWIPGAKIFLENWLFSENAITKLLFITHISLGTISLTIGAELEWKRIKDLGKSILFISLFEAFGTLLVVTIITYLIWRNFPLSLLLGAVSSATAPAATVAVIQQYKARGPLTKTIIAVVGIDDAISFMIFAFAITVVKTSLSGNDIDIMSGFLRPMLEILTALLTGAVIGFVGARVLIRTKDQESDVFLLGSIILWITGIAGQLDVSELLANMAGGAVIVNMYPSLKNKIRSSFRSFMPLFYALFFIIGGAYLDVSVIPTVWVLSLVYFLTRSAGKIGGATLGAFFGNALPQVRRWIGFDLLPQVGAAIALALVVQQVFGSGEYGREGIDLSQKIINVLLISTLLTEFIGPYLTKISLIKSGEAND